jgi:hypothetical protein
VVIFNYLPIVAVRLSLVAPEGAPAKSWFPYNRTAVLMVMGPIVEPPQGPVSAETLQHKERLHIKILGAFHDSRVFSF